MADKTLIAEILLPLALPGTFSYMVPAALEKYDLIGKRVIVPFGRSNKSITGIVVSTSNKKPVDELKTIADVCDDYPILSPLVLRFWKWMSGYYVCTDGEVMNSALPAVLNVTGESRFSLSKEGEFDISGIKERALQIVNALENAGELSLGKIIASTGIANAATHLSVLVKNDVVRMREDFRIISGSRKVTYLGLSSRVLQGNNFEEVVSSLSRSRGQLKALMTLVELTGWDGESGGDAKIAKSEMLKKADVSDSILKALVDKGLFVIEYRAPGKQETDLVQTRELNALSADQRNCLKSIKSQFEIQDVVLLKGVTSSGKTEIYCHLMEEALASGRQVLYLLPEIGLTTQLINRLTAFFGERVAVYHSRLSQGQKLSIWQSLTSGKEEGPGIILGARSAIFLPFTKLGLVIVDEEHDRSYKQQDPSPRYHARDSAIVLASLHTCKVLLGSATPSLESRENSLTGKYGYAELTGRYGGFEMPELMVVDLKDFQKKRRMHGALSFKLKDEIQACLSTGEQVILFQNRRGFAPLLICQDCGFTPVCNNCDVSLTYHKKGNMMLCHYCGHREATSPSCGRCKSGSYAELGTGTQKVEEVLSSLFPNVNLARFDLDSTRRKDSFSRLLSDFEKGTIDILIGTQMVTKGLDFGNVGLVGIINADNLLKFPDFRSFERTFQMLTQVAGRAGRKSKRGKVVVQTYEHDHSVLKFFLAGDFEGYLASELAERKEFSYPPYFRLIEIRLKHADRIALTDAGTHFSRDLKGIFGQKILGPEFPYIERIRNMYSLHFILRLGKFESTKIAKARLEEIINNFPGRHGSKGIRIQVDVDPF